MGEALVKRNVHSLSDLSQFVQTNLKRSSARIVDYTRSSDTDTDTDTDTDDTESDSCYEEDGSQEPNDQDQVSSDVTSSTSEREEDDGEDDLGDAADVYAGDHDDEHVEDDQAGESRNVTKDLSKVQQQTFQGCRVYDKVSATEAFKFFRIRVGNSIKYVHKQTACWLLTDGKNRLSSDRLMRVRQSGRWHWIRRKKIFVFLFVSWTFVDVWCWCSRCSSR